jgi:magnesium transporter
MLAASVITLFEGLIAKVAVLAAFQSVVAGLGGNAANQSLAMLVRALALGEIPANQRLGLLVKQITVCFLQGLAVGLVVGFGVYLWRGNIYLGLVLVLALVGNLVVAGIVGTLIPLGLKSINMDPAMGGTVLISALTDTLGFLIFLSLAALFVPYL